jgi:hypothetical protein
MTTKMCDNCRFWLVWKDQPNRSHTLGECRRHAPGLFMQRDELRTKWPATAHDDFCGSHRWANEEAE